MFQHMCALCRHTRGRFQRVTPHHTPHTPQHKTQHHDTRHNTTRGRKRRRQDKSREKREKIHFQCGGAWPFFIGVVIFRLIPFAEQCQVKFIFDFSALWPRINFSTQLQFSFFFYFFCLCSYSFKFFRIIYLCSYSFFLPELILDKFSVEGYLLDKARAI